MGVCSKRACSGQGRGIYELYRKTTAKDETTRTRYGATFVTEDKQKKELGEDEDVPGERRHLHFTDHVAQMKTHDNEQWTKIIRLSQVSNNFTGSRDLLRESAARAKEEEDVDSK
jgi:hypothetical protein